MLVGIAQEQGFLDINDPTSNYLGTGWTSCSTSQELAITVRHQLTMTTGLDDGVLPDNDCTDPACLQYLAAPGSRWAYHNAPYTLLRGVIQAATGLNENQWTYQRVGAHIGMGGLWVLTGWNNVFFSRTRDMARYGLLLLNRGIWNSDTVLHDQSYFDAMTTSSQTLNESYGYLTWLNGQASFMVPGVQLQFPGSIVPNAPADMFMALGKNDQKIHVVPSQGLVVVRMGNAADTTSLVPIVFDNELWARLNGLDCTTGIGRPPSTPSQAIHYDATMERVIMGDVWRDADVAVSDATGRLVFTAMAVGGVVDMRALPAGAYILSGAKAGMPRRVFRFVK